ncbi:MAG: NYN domain-containing protein [Candidatus Paceibacterota bacterium]
MENIETNNIAFIDGQNLHLGTTLSDNSWKVNLFKFKVYLEKKYRVKEAYYFLGYVQEVNQEIYSEIQKAGFILVFKQHNPAMLGKKKGNVDTDIVFEIMKKIYRKNDFNKIVLVSGDGDYKLLVDFLIEENKLKKILFPNKKFASSLYKSLGGELFDYLDNKDIKNKISI